MHGARHAKQREDDRFHGDRKAESAHGAPHVTGTDGQATMHERMHAPLSERIIVEHGRHP